MRILDKIQQDNPDAKVGINKSAATIFNEQDISFEHVFYNLLFDAVFVTSKSSFSLYFEFILSQLMTLSALSLQLYICHFCSFLNYLCEMVGYVWARVSFLLMCATIVELYENIAYKCTYYTQGLKSLIKTRENVQLLLYIICQKSSTLKVFSIGTFHGLCSSRLSEILSLAWWAIWLFQAWKS